VNADRILRGVKLVIADDHKGLRAATRRVPRRTSDAACTGCAKRSPMGRPSNA
jgi:hypothetical protein